MRGTVGDMSFESFKTRVVKSPAVSLTPAFKTHEHRD